MWTFLENNWLGLITILGVSITIWQVIRTKKAADAAAVAAKRTKQDLNKNFLISDLSTALSTIDEIKLLNRKSLWENVLDRCSKLTYLLGNIRTQGFDLSSREKKSLLNGIEQTRVIEEDIEDRILEKNQRFDIGRYNKFLSKIADDLNSIIGRKKLDLSRGA